MYDGALDGQIRCVILDTRARYMGSVFDVLAFVALAPNNPLHVMTKQDPLQVSPLRSTSFEMSDGAEDNTTGEINAVLQ